MRLNRRSVLLGLGTISASVGGAFGSGAFSSVEATRTVNIETSDDSNALLSFEANNPSTTDSGTPEDNNNNIISTETPDGSGASVIKLEQTDLNEKATTTFSDALKVSNDGEKNVGVSVNPDASDDPNDLIGDVLDIQDTNGNSIVDGGTKGGNAVNLDAGGDINLTIVIDLQNDTVEDISTITSVVFAARQDDYSSSQ
jgi:hypothetical protein